MVMMVAMIMVVVMMVVVEAVSKAEGRPIVVWRKIRRIVPVRRTIAGRTICIGRVVASVREEKTVAIVAVPGRVIVAGRVIVRAIAGSHCQEDGQRRELKHSHKMNRACHSQSPVDRKFVRSGHPRHLDVHQ